MEYGYFKFVCLIISINSGGLMAQGKYQIYKDKSGKFRYRLLAGNLQPILSGEGYNTRVACKNGIASVKKMRVEKTAFL